MKALLNLFKGLAVVYWLLAAALFTSVLFFPKVIDGLYGAYSGAVGQPSSSEVISSSEDATSSSDEITSSSEDTVSSSEEISSSSEEVVSSSEEISSSSEELSSSSEETSLPESQPLRANVPSDSEEVRCLAIAPQCGWELVINQTEVLVISESEAPFDVEYFISEESLLDDDLFAVLFVFNIDTQEWEQIQVPLFEPDVIDGESFWFDQETGILFYAEWVDVWETGGPGPIPEDEVVIGQLTREEFVTALEEILIYSAIFMLPFTILVFTIGSKVKEATDEIEPEITVENVEEKSEKKKTQVKTRAIGVTGIRVRK